MDWYEGNSKFIVPRDTNYCPILSQARAIVGVKGRIKLLIPEYPVNKEQYKKRICSLYLLLSSEVSGF